MATEKEKVTSELAAHFKFITGGAGPFKVYADEAVTKFWPLVEAVKDGGCWCGALMPGDGLCLLCEALKGLGIEVEDGN